MSAQRISRIVNNARLGRIVDSLDEVRERHDLLIGEQIVVFTMLLAQTIRDAPADIRAELSGDLAEAMLKIDERAVIEKYGLPVMGGEQIARDTQ